MSLQTWGLVVLGVIAGVPIYALIAGYTGRFLRTSKLGHFPGNEFSKACAFHRGEDCDRDRCDEHQWVAATFWPISWAAFAVRAVINAVLVAPARAAYRAALRSDQ